MNDKLENEDLESYRKQSLLALRNMHDRRDISPTSSPPELAQASPLAQPPQRHLHLPMLCGSAQNLFGNEYV